jgi:hypothetical protein
MVFNFQGNPLFTVHLKIRLVVWVLRSFQLIFVSCDQEVAADYSFQKTKKCRIPKTWFYKILVFSALPSATDLKLAGDIRVSTRNSVVCLFCLFSCLFIFHKHKQTKHTLEISHPSQHQMF